MIILKWIFKKLVAGDLYLIVLVQDTDIPGSFEGVNEISSSIKSRGLSWLTEELLASQK
jgi:hypothetical protein